MKLLDQVRSIIRKKHYSIRTEEAYIKPVKLPVVLSKEEARKVLSFMTGDCKLMAQLLYGSGLRLMECVRLRVQDIDFERSQITVRDGKGMKDRVTLLPDQLKPFLDDHLKKV